MRAASGETSESEKTHNALQTIVLGETTPTEQRAAGSGAIYIPYRQGRDGKNNTCKKCRKIIKIMKYFVDIIKNEVNKK